MNYGISKKRKLNEYIFKEKPETESIDLSLPDSKSESKIERIYNHIYFYSEVNRENIYDLCALIKEAEEENTVLSIRMNLDPIPIYLHINSYGGCIFSAFNAIDLIEMCKVPIYSIIEGCAASAGTILSMVCKKRYIRPTSYMLIHQLSSGTWGKMCEIEDEYNNLTQFMDVIKKLYLKYTNIPKKELNELLKHDLWLDSKKCLQYNLVDELWK